jgi:hypothetical protein
MRLALTTLALMLSTNAFAGGIGLLATGGMYSDTVHFYDSSKEFQQYQQTQTIANYGSGIEFALGDRDDKILGLARWYFLQETPQKDPALSTGLVDPDNVVANWRDTPRNVGMFSVGLQWSFWSRDKLSLNATAMFGSGFLTTDHTEFFVAEGGGGASYRVARDMDLHLSVQYSLRNRKGLSHGMSSFAGVRYLFD